MAHDTESSEHPEAPATCGAGLAEHAAIPARLAVMFRGLAETLDLHREMLVLSDEEARREDAVYHDLATRWRRIAEEVADAAARMEAQRELPLGAHDETAWSERHLRAFTTFVKAQSEVLALLEPAARHDEQMLAAMSGG
jgi:hypothetical protein